MVICCVCGAEHDVRGTGVLYRSGDGKWWCADETQCFARRAIWRALALALDADNRRCALTGQEVI